MAREKLGQGALIRLALRGWKSERERSRCRQLLFDQLSLLLSFLAHFFQSVANESCCLKQFINKNLYEARER